MISTIPVMIMLFSSILKIEKTNIFQIIGVVFSFAGVIMIITKANLEILKNLDFNKGDITMVIAMFSWALYSTLLKGKQYELNSNIITSSSNYFWFNIFDTSLFY